MCMKYFHKALHEMGPQGSTTRNTQLISQNDFPLTQIKLVYYLTRKTLKSSSLVQNICMFLFLNFHRKLVCSICCKKKMLFCYFHICSTSFVYFCCFCQFFLPIGYCSLHCMLSLYFV